MTESKGGKSLQCLLSKGSAVWCGQAAQSYEALYSLYDLGSVGWQLHGPHAVHILRNFWQALERFRSRARVFPVHVV